jgi:hypothetical protein
MADADVVLRVARDVEAIGVLSRSSIHRHGDVAGGRRL